MAYFETSDYGMKECQNKRCSRKDVLIQTTGKYCTSCGARLRQVDLHAVNGRNSIIDSPLKPGESPTSHHVPPSTSTSLVVVDKRHSAKVNDTFTCDADLKGCPIANKARVNVPFEMWNRWIWLATFFDTEWMAYLKGEQTIDSDGLTLFTITDMYFPKQRVTPVHVEADDGEVTEGTIGAVHSHVNMNATFSGEDEMHCNHPVELVVNRRADVSSSCRIKLECGRFARTSGKVMLIGCDTDTILAAELKSKMTVTKHTQPAGYHSPRSHDVANGVSFKDGTYHTSRGNFDTYAEVLAAFDDGVVWNT